MFPLWIQGALRGPVLDSAQARRLLGLLEQRLAHRQAASIQRQGSELSFRVAFQGRTYTQSPLRSIDAGHISVQAGDPGRILYRLSHRRSARLGLFLATMLGLVSWASASRPQVSLVVFGACLLWLTGVSYLFARLRMRRFLGDLFENL